MPFIKSKPSEFLIVVHKGKVRNLGIAGSSFVWPGASFVRVPSQKQEACFEMTEETSDGIPLRFKGIVIFRIVDPVAAAQLFDFSSAQSAGEMTRLINHVCLGELRSLASRLTMKQCIEERKALTAAVAEALLQVTGPSDTARAAGGWGVALDVVQVAQVFIVDEELRKKLEAELRNQLTTKSKLSEIQMQREIKAAQIQSDQRLLEESLALEHQRVAVEAEKLRLLSQLELERLEADVPVRIQRLARERDVRQVEIEMRGVANQARALEVENELMMKRGEAELRQVLAPLEQMPDIAKALGQMYQGAQLSIYGGEANPVAQMAPLIDLLAQRLRQK